ncbi:hypothetical protein B0H16DRAFT_80035 [Mycena metata]|uniref:BRCT domain-containing protein n=1 Tax=Mycena metata TaxID=1033252 RepID=A0AAD7NTZ6_9AGAR|nr:hypothetical protein B0H16DRAFT_80035 [Mycena metata]
MDVDKRDGAMVEESQTSQLLRDALGSHSQEEHSMLSGDTIPIEEFDMSKDMSSSDSVDRPAPLYRYHGLASTQTQSLHDDDDPQNTLEGSQKENLSASRDALYSSSNQVQTMLVLPSPARPPRDSLVPRSKQSPAKATTNTKTVSFESPKAVETPNKLPESRYSARSLKRATPALKRDHSPDSFAGDFADPAEKFIAASKQFDMPLAELERAPSPEESSKAGTEGTILVAATPTPSVSSNSQSQSQPRGSQDDDEEEDYSTHHRQPEPEYPPDEPASQESIQYPSSESPSSSYRHMYDKVSPPLSPTQIIEPQLTEPTQLILEPTQIIESKQIIEPTQLIEQYTSDAILPQQSVSISVSNVTSTTAPKSLFNTIPEHKRNRYAHIAQAPRAQGNTTANVVNSSPAAATAGPVVMEATQPAFDEPGLPPARFIGMSRPLGGGAAPRPRAVLDERTEIIPDSEPPREASPSPVKPSNRSPLKPRPPPADDSDTDPDNEVVPDSMDVDVSNDPNDIRARSIMMREEEEDEEDEAPLANATGASGKKGNVEDLKGKGKAVEMAPPPPKAKAAGVVVKKPKPNPPPIRTRRTRAGSPEVPSSVPHQDHPAADQATPASKATRRGAATRGKSTGARGGKKKANGRAKRPVKQVSEAEESDDELLMPKSEMEEEVSTESAGEDDDDDDDEYVAGPSNRKRKRAIKAESPTVPNLRKGAKGRPAKRARAASGSTTSTTGTRVFALWRRDGNYYSGTVHSQSSAGLYKVNFDDHTSEKIKLDQMRLCLPKIGDTAFISGVQHAVKITSISTMDAGQEAVVVLAGKEEQDLPVSDIRIPARTIHSCWLDDRFVTAQNVVCQVKPAKSVVASPTASRMSVSSVGSSKRPSGVFSRVGFCITTTLAADKEKEAINAQIVRHGGLVIDDWEDVFVMKGKRNSKRWVLDEGDVVLKFPGVDRVFLLSEDPSHTPKYLIALALGIPCLRTDFVKHAIATEELSDWTMYLLPSGFSDVHQCRVSQFVNMDWGEGSEDMKEILNNPVAHKAFKDNKILCVSRDVLNASGKNAAIPPILLCMGATSVEAVRDVKNASLKLDQYDYIVNKDDNADIAKMTATNIVSWDWVKDALISRCVPTIT